MERDELDTPEAPLGFIYEWKASEIIGHNNENHISKMITAGWPFVPPMRHPEMHSKDDRIFMKGLLLMERAESLIEEFREKERHWASSQMAEMDAMNQEKWGLPEPDGFVFVMLMGDCPTEFVVRDDKMLLEAIKEISGLPPYAMRKFVKKSWEIRKNFGICTCLNYLDDEDRFQSIQMWPKDPKDCRTARAWVMDRDRDVDW